MFYIYEVADRLVGALLFYSLIEAGVATYYQYPLWQFLIAVAYGALIIGGAIKEVWDEERLAPIQPAPFRPYDPREDPRYPYIE